MKKKKKITLEDLILDLIVYAILIIVLIVTFYPMWYVLAASFTSSTELAKNPGILLFPKSFSFDGYKLVFNNPLILNGFKNTIFILAVGLPINIFLTLICGYFMSRDGDKVMLKKPIVGLIMFTMFFSGGMIPAYLNIQQLGLYNSLWSVVLTSALSVYNAIICKTAIEAVPASLTESANIDGASDWQILTKIIVPLIKPTLAVLLLYYAVSHWNSWFSASIYLKDNIKLPLQNIIRSVLIENSSLGTSADSNLGDYNAYAETIKYAAIVITTIPILCVYPFLQKHFTKGVMIGAVKG